MTLFEICSSIRTIQFSGEYLFSLKSLYNLLKTNIEIKLEECLIMPYYICNNKRIELYQFEMYCTSKYSFEEYLTKKTGYKEIGDIPKDIVRLRRNCFLHPDEPQRLAKFLEYIFYNSELRSEVEQAFGEYSIDNLYAIIY